MVSSLITGARGFLGRNLASHLAQRTNVRLFQYDIGNTAEELHRWLAEAEVIFHLAGVNRPERAEEFEEGNAGFTETLANAIRQSGRTPHVIMSSSIQAELDNPYGRSKRRGEEVLQQLAAKTGTPVSIFRLTNLFGKWCRPNYNSVVATFCHNIANDLPIEIRDPSHQVRLAYVDDVVEAFLQEADEKPSREDGLVAPDPVPTHSITLGDLADRIRFFHGMRHTLAIPDFASRFNRQLYATYLSYVPPRRWVYNSEIKADARGDLAELMKSDHFGQIFVSRTHPGVTRGNHYHHTKTEKFMVVSGEARIRLRGILDTDITEYTVRGEDYAIVEIPPGFTHSITNTGLSELITLFWVCEPFNADRPDTYFLPVDRT